MENQIVEGAGFTNKLASGGKRFVLLTALLALIIPPAGLAMILYLLLSRTDRRRVLLLGALLLITTAVGSFAYLKTYNVYVNHKNNYHYQKTELKTVAIGPLSGLSFQKPVEFQETHNSTVKNTKTITFDHINKAGYAVGLLGISETKDSLAADAKYTDGIKFLMNEGKGKDYDQYTAYFKDFIKNFNSPDYTVQLSKPKEFSNGDIKAKAWIFDVKATTLGSKNLAPLQGQFVFADGKQSFYYFSVMAIDANWQSNNAFWHQVVNSIKIDQ